MILDIASMAAGGAITIAILLSVQLLETSLRRRSQ